MGLRASSFHEGSVEGRFVWGIYVLNSKVSDLGLELL